MNVLIDWCPRPELWSVPWANLEARYEWVRSLYECPQDPEFHAEGDVGTHTLMSCEAVSQLPGFSSLSDTDRAIVFAGVLLHDIGKPRCTRREPDGRIASRGHSARGETTARELLWRLGAPFPMREEVVALVRHHQVPFFLLDRGDSQRIAFSASHRARSNLLALVAEADGRGRHCAREADQKRLLDNVALFVEYCREQDCLDHPRRFPSDQSRFEYFRTPGRDPGYPAYENVRSEVLLMSGLPGAGKDYWIQRHGGGRPVISLDGIRRELDVAPEEPQGRVVRAARERAKDLLRQGQSFIWNATNVSRNLRGQLVSFFASYQARVRIVYVEAPERELRRRNERAHAVPDGVLDRLIERWSVPDRTEAHEVEFHTAE